MAMKKRHTIKKRHTMKKQPSLEKILISKYPLVIQEILNKISGNNGKIQEKSYNTNGHVLNELCNYGYIEMEEKSGKLYITKKGRQLKDTL